MKIAFSFGGGRQSRAALVLAADGKIEVDCFVFANVGDDSENPDTLEYVHNYAAPYAREHGLELVEVQRVFRDKRNPTLLAHLQRDARGVAIPMRMAESGAPGNRKCTYDWKIRVVSHYLQRERGWSPPWNVALGISWDESHRISDAQTGVDGITYTKSYPLCDLRLRVDDCARLVAEAGLPPAPKSSCWFCPYHSRAEWARMRLNRPDLFQRSVELEQNLNAIRDKLGKDHLYFTDRLKPLDISIPEGAEQLGMFDDTDASCTSGFCFT
jgi:hypothetical protein